MSEYIESYVREHDVDGSLEKQLVDECKELDLVLSSHQSQLLVAHLLLMLEKNRTMNLTSIRDPHDAVSLHAVDSLALLHQARETKGKILDIGTGGGYPGIPLAIMTQRPTVLMDSVRKKVAACDEFVHALGIDDLVSTTSERAESYALKHRNEYGLVVARAVGPIGMLCEYAAPLLSKNGTLLITKGTPSEEELAQGTKAAAMSGLKSVSRETLTLPGAGATREIIAFRSVKAPSIKLPRPVGEAKKHPLGL